MILLQANPPLLSVYVALISQGFLESRLYAESIEILRKLSHAAGCSAAFLFNIAYGQPNIIK